MIKIKRVLMLIAACAVVLVVSGLTAHAQVQLFDPGEPGSVLIFPKFVKGTVATGVPATEIEISVHCPTVLLLAGGGFCSEAGATVRMRGHWVCPGQFSTQICRETDFNISTTVEGTVSINPDGSPVGQNFATVRVPPAPCPSGYLIVWAIDTQGRPIKFDGLVGNAVVRWNNRAAGAYEAIAIQAHAAGATRSLITSAGTTSGPMAFTGAPGAYAAIAGTVMSTIKYDTDLGTTLAADGASTTSLTLLTLDVLSNRPNNQIFVDLNFYDASEFLWSTFTNYICWQEQPISSIDPGLVRQNMSRKGFFYSVEANKVPQFGIVDGAGLVTQLGLIDTVECSGTGPCVQTVPVTPTNNPSILNHYMYRTFDDSQPIPTLFIP